MEQAQVPVAELALVAELAPLLVLEPPRGREPPRVREPPVGPVPAQELEFARAVAPELRQMRELRVSRQ